MKRNQRGVVLLVALIALVGITLAGIALMRAVDTGLVIAGNLAFKQATIAAGDAALEQAIEWLAAQNQNALAGDQPAAGYYSSWRDGCDLTGAATASIADDDVQWQPGGAARANCQMVAMAVGADRLPQGYTASFVINRMCSQPGLPNDAGVVCSAYQGGGGTVSPSTKGGSDYGYWALSNEAQQYYRITARIVGPRNTESFVQGIVAF
ncbi:MAG: hypothetical protein N2441_00755 [Rhodocyclaceae bacterium]|nr:hypothetical protein [Rhodocyclaceae bacterium]